MNKLSNYLQPENTPVTNSRKNFVNAIDWDVYHPRDTVSGIHVRTISFNSLVGGSAILGGLANGDGLVIVNNAGGTQVVRLDNSGIVITAGTISGVQFTGTTTSFTGTMDSITIIGQSINNGTITNNKLITGGSMNSAAVGTPVITGGTMTSGVINNSTIGTPALSGGTLNPTVYQNGGGTVGASATAVYVKTVAPGTTFGTLIFSNGLLISST